MKFTLRLPPHLDAQLKRAAEQSGKSMQKYIVDLLQKEEQKNEPQRDA